MSQFGSSRPNPPDPPIQLRNYLRPSFVSACIPHFRFGERPRGLGPRNQNRYPR